MGKKQKYKKSGKTQQVKRPKGTTSVTVDHDTALDQDVREDLTMLMDIVGKCENSLVMGDKSSSVKSSRSSDPLDDSDGMPKLENATVQKPWKICDAKAPNLLSDFVGTTKQSRSEKKMRRLLMKLDLKPIENVSRVVMVKSNNIMLYINNPEVYKSPYAEIYICLGPVHVGDIHSAATTQAAERYINRDDTRDDKLNFDLNNENIEHGDDNDVLPADVDGVDDYDIQLVRMQANCTLKAAISALKRNGNDVVDAIMALTPI